MSSPETLGEIIKIRERLGKPDFAEDEIDVCISTATDRLLIWFNEHVEDQELVEQNLQTTNEYIWGDEGLPVTPARLTALYLSMFGGREIEELALRIAKNLDKDGRNTAALLLDVNKGYCLALGTILVASASQFQTIDNVFSGYRYAELGRIYWSEPRLPQMLQDDSVGGSLFAWMINHTQEAGSPLVKTHELQKGMVAGAELARDCFGTFYPRAESFLRRAIGN